MASLAEAFFKTIKNKRLIVMGAGISNTPVIEMLHSKGAVVEVRDRKSNDKLSELCGELDKMSVSYVFGENYLENLKGDYILRSPGIRFDLPQFQKAQAEGAVLTSEMELFFDLCPCKIIAVTGSDGKSTTTTMIYELLRAEGYRCHLGGNIGNPLLPKIESIRPEDFVVVELSSFQLHTMKKSADIAVVTNLSPNHLDYHKDYREYVDAKKNIFLHQNPTGILVLNLDNGDTRDLAPLSKGTVRYFSRKTEMEEGAVYRDGVLWMCEDGKKEKLLDRSELFLKGDHNVENFMAAVLAVKDFLSGETIRKVANQFRGIPHRIEFVRELDGVIYYNNSIASSPSRVQACFQTFQEKLIIIAGGSDKKIPFVDFGVEINKYVKLLLLSGATTPKIYKAVVSAPNYNPDAIRIVLCSSIFEALKVAQREAKAGDNVILAPACPSFDRFKNFEERGDLFKAAVWELKHE